jgi:hypothetical protein
MRDRDLVGLRIRNTENVQDEFVGISFRRRDRLKRDVVWGVLGRSFSLMLGSACATDSKCIWTNSGCLLVMVKGLRRRKGGP